MQTWFNLDRWLATAAFLLLLPGLAKVDNVLTGAVLIVALTLACAMMMRGQAKLFARIGSLFTCLTESERSVNESLATVVGLAALSRRTGLASVADVRVNWPALQAACYLVATASDEVTIAAEERLWLQHARQHYWRCVRDCLLGAAVTMTITAVLCSYQLAFADSELAADTLLAGAVMVALLLLASWRLQSLWESEQHCLLLVFQGCRAILSNNSIESVYERLSLLIPDGLRQPIDKLHNPFFDTSRSHVEKS